MTTTRSASCAISRFAVPRPGGRPAPVVARVTELQRDPEHAGELLVPLGPSSRHLDKAGTAQDLCPIDAHTARQLRVPEVPWLPGGQGEPTTRPQQA
jgi:hypothetical protein